MIKWRCFSTLTQDNLLVLRMNTFQKMMNINLKFSTSLFLGSASLFSKVLKALTFWKTESKNSRKTSLPRLKRQRRKSVNLLNSILLRNWCSMSRPQTWSKKARLSKDMLTTSMLIFGNKWSQCFSILHMLFHLNCRKKLKRQRETIQRWSLSSNIPTSHSWPPKYLSTSKFNCFCQSIPSRQKSL